MQISGGRAVETEGKANTKPEDGLGVLREKSQQGDGTEKVGASAPARWGV